MAKRPRVFEIANRSLADGTRCTEHERSQQRTAKDSYNLCHNDSRTSHQVRSLLQMAAIAESHRQCFHKSSMKFPFLSVKFPFSPLNFLAKITKFPFKFPSYSKTSRRLWRRLRINNLYSGASSLMRLCLKCKDVEHTGS